MPRSDEHAFGRPTAEDIESIAAAFGVSLSDAERDDYRRLVADAVEGVESVRHARPFDAGLEPTTYAAREPGRRPDEGDDPLNAWITRGRVEGADDGPLSGVTVGLKDSVALAGYEMTAGSSVLEGFVPTIDATVVTRLLDAGAAVVGKTNMESFAWSGSGDTSDFGPVTNPHDAGRLAGGSSSGSGAAPAAGDCDVAIGTDQAGSIRIPSSWCGLVGVKPTYGLVPYTGILPLERSLDHAGPMGRSVETVATALEALAGEDVRDGVRLDSRQPRGVAADGYAGAVGDEVDGLSVGVLEEGFGWEFSEPAVDEVVRAATEVFEGEGVAVESTSVPRHREATSAWAAIGTQGGARLLREAGAGTNHDGWCWPRLARTLDSFRRARANDLPPSAKRSLFAAAFLEREYGVEAYAKARDVALSARRAYDVCLDEYDALLLPTTAVRAFEKAPDLDRVASVNREVVTIANTCPFNLTGHPALTVPCAKPDGLPVGLMLVGSRLDESTLFALGAAFERAADWETRE